MKRRTFLSGIGFLGSLGLPAKVVLLGAQQDNQTARNALPTDEVMRLVNNHAAQSAIVLDPQAGPLARKAAELLQNRVEQRTRARLPLIEGTDGAKDLPIATRRIFIVTPRSKFLRLRDANRFALPTTDQLGEDGFSLTTTSRDIILSARPGRGMIYGVGKLLHSATYPNGSMLANPSEGLDKPVMPDRVLYIPPHLNTFYQEEPAEAIEPIIEEVALWGVNALSVWLDQAHFDDPFDKGSNNQEGRIQWEKMKMLLKFGKTLGLKPGLVISANDAYKNQLKPDVIGKAGAQWNQEKLINPMIPAGRALIMRDKRNLYQDLANSGIQLDNMLIFAYDPGGCFDDNCKPWVLTFLKLSEELVNTLHEYHPKAQGYVTDWFCNHDEGKMIAGYLNKHEQTALKGVWKQDRNSVERYADLDKRYRLLVFVDVTNMGGWGVIGAQPLPTMIQYYVGQGPKNGITGLMIYTEGIYDDYNKFLATQQAWNPSTDVDDFCRQYATYFFGGNIEEEFCEIVRRSERGWVDPRIPWPKHVFIDVPVEAEKLEHLTLLAGDKLEPKIRNSWRWQLFEYRARIGRLAAKLRTQPEFQANILRALDAGVPKAALMVHVKEKEEALERYNTLVTELRERVYHEPLSRFPPMDIEGAWMTEIIQVPATKWKETIKELRGKLET